MPRIWMDYCQFLVSQCKITRSRRTFDRALRALPVTQHPRIWPLYLRFVRDLPLPETAIRVYRRYLKVRTYCTTLSPYSSCHLKCQGDFWFYFCFTGVIFQSVFCGINVVCSIWRFLAVIQKTLQAFNNKLYGWLRKF